jgi:hypothetical protein
MAKDDKGRHNGAEIYGRGRRRPARTLKQISRGERLVWWGMLMAAIAIVAAWLPDTLQ